MQLSVVAISAKRHAEMVTRDPGAELVALCDIRPCEELGIEAYDARFFIPDGAIAESEFP